MKKQYLLHIATFFILFSAGALATQIYMPELKMQLISSYASEDPISTSTNFIEKPEPIQLELPPPPLALPVPERVITKEYDNHLYAGENNGFDLIENEIHFRRLINEQKLTWVNRGPGYEVMELTHSYPYLTTYSKGVLEELGQTFQNQSKPGEFFTLTSITRTPEQQESLRKRNRNATAGISSHSYGVSFDISYMRFNGKKGSNRAAQKKLEKILEEFQKAEKIFFIKERQQQCYHITIR